MATRLIIVQYAGDYREAYNRFSMGESETYYAQKYSVDVVADIACKVDEISTLCCMTEESYNEVLGNGVRAIGAGFSEKIDTKKLINLIENFRPTHLVLRTPNTEVLRWAIQKNLKILVTLADSFNSKNIRQKFQNYQLVSLLNRKQVDWVGNHGVTSSDSLVRMGVSPDKVIPWDWPHNITPNSFETKKFPEKSYVWEALYVGSISETKGVGDALRAVANLASKQVTVKLTIVGKGEIEKFSSLAKELKVEKNVAFLGLLPNKDIVPRMREADIILIPSRHEYPEGFPMTIYEALCSRTPIIASDHPMFSDKLVSHSNALVFPSGNSVELAKCISHLMSSPDLYQRISFASLETWNSLQIPVKWGDFIMSWLSSSSHDNLWLFNNRISPRSCQVV
jgi:glycosyltransferase involved in cell wall biosynthesis